MFRVNNPDIRTTATPDMPMVLVVTCNGFIALNRMLCFNWVHVFSGMHFIQLRLKVLPIITIYIRKYPFIGKIIDHFLLVSDKHLFCHIQRPDNLEEYNTNFLRRLTRYMKIVEAL